MAEAVRPSRDRTAPSRFAPTRRGIMRGCPPGTARCPNSSSPSSFLSRCRCVLAGCKINSINYFPPTPAHFRVVNVLGTTTPINVIVNGVTIWSGVELRSHDRTTSKSTNVTTKIQVTLAGSDVAIVEQTYNPAGNQNYTLVVYGTTDGAGPRRDGRYHAAAAKRQVCDQCLQCGAHWQWLGDRHHFRRPLPDIAGPGHRRHHSDLYLHPVHWKQHLRTVSRPEPTG